MSFRERLQQATERGKQTRAAQLNEAAAKALSEEECKRRHSQYRLMLTEHIEKCLGEMADNFPGFRMETVVEGSGWGSAVTRDDIRLEAGRRGTFFSRLQLVVGPYNSYHVLHLGEGHRAKQRSSFSHLLSATSRCRSAELPSATRAVGARLRRAVLCRGVS